jgi:hypothetical protein
LERDDADDHAVGVYARARSGLYRAAAVHFPSPLGLILADLSERKADPTPLRDAAGGCIN